MIFFSVDLCSAAQPNASRASSYNLFAVAAQKSTTVDTEKTIYIFFGSFP